MLHFDRPPEQNVAQKSYKGLGKGSTFSASVEVTKLIDFGAHAGRRTHDLPSSGLVMRVACRQRGCSSLSLRLVCRLCWAGAPE